VFFDLDGPWMGVDEIREPVASDKCDQTSSINLSSRSKITTWVSLMLNPLDF